MEFAANFRSEESKQQQASVEMKGSLPYSLQNYFLAGCKLSDLSDLTFDRSRILAVADVFSSAMSKRSRNLASKPVQTFAISRLTLFLEMRCGCARSDWRGPSVGDF